MNKYKIYIRLLLPLILFTAVLPYLVDKGKFLILDKPIESRVLLIEGWLNKDALDRPPFSYDDYDTIFIAGIRKPTDWDFLLREKDRLKQNHKGDDFWFPTNGFLFLRNTKKILTSDSVKLIKVIARGTQAKGQNAHFYISVKDSILGNAFVKEERDTFIFKVSLSSEEAENLNLFFDNDLLTEDEDINLVVNEIILDEVSFIPSGNKMVYIPANSKPNNFNLIESNAEELKHYLTSVLKLTTPVIVTDTLYTKRNLTLAAAKAFSVYLKKNNLKPGSLNIYTYDFHSRRTYLAYKKVLDREIALGIIIKRCPDCISSRKKTFLGWYKFMYEEILSYVITIFS